MTDEEKIKVIVSIVDNLNINTGNGKCPSDFGLKNNCSMGIYKDTCPKCWIKSLEE